MRMTSKAVLAGIGAMILCGAATAAEAETRVVRVTFPDGSIQQLRYGADVVPRIVIVPVHRPAVPFRLVRQEVTASMMHFDRLMAAMDRHAAEMMRRIARVSRLGPDGGAGLRMAEGEKLPRGTIRYSFVSTTSGGKTCSRSMRVVSDGSSKSPRVETARSGDCAAEPKGAPAAGAPASQPVKAIPTI